MAEPVPSLLRIRVVQPYNSGNSEITSNLPHLHQVKFRVDAMQPGNPSNASLGSFTVPLHPPGTEGYAAAKTIYDKLDRFQRCEFYISHDGASLGKFKYAGIVRAIVKKFGANPVFELQGMSDIALANLSKPFPGELLSNDVTSALLKSYLGTNELGWADTFSPFTSGNYNSTNILGATSGTWSSSTDDGFTVATCSTGTGAALISKSGAAANDRWHTHYVEVTGRLSPSADASNAGRVGVGLSLSSSDLTFSNNSVLGSVTALKQNGRYVLTATLTVAGSTGFNVQNALSNADDPQGMIPITIGLLATEGGAASASASVSVIVNGKVVIYVPCSFVPSTATAYPFIFFGTPASGSAACYLMNLIQYTRFTADGPSTASVFAPGTITAASHSLGYGIDPGPTFLEVWTKLATREGWYWRYTPQPFVVGSRTLGVIDFAADPGVDRSVGSSNPNVIFER